MVLTSGGDRVAESCHRLQGGHLFHISILFFYQIVDRCQRQLVIAIVIIFYHYYDSDKNTTTMVISMTIDDNPSAADGEQTWCPLTCPKSTTSR